MDQDKNDQNITNQPIEPRQPPLPPITQPTTGVPDGRPFTPPTPDQNTETNQLTEVKPPKKSYFFNVLGILQIVGIAIYLCVMLLLSLEASSGASGTEFIALSLFASLVPIVTVIALINLIGLPIYLLKNKSHSGARTFYIISLIISALVVFYGAYNMFRIFTYQFASTTESSKLSEQIERARQFDHQTSLNGTAETANQDVREAVWKQMSDQQKAEIIGTWQAGKVSKITWSDGAVMTSTVDKSYAGQEVYVISFPSKQNATIGDVVVYADVNTFTVIGYGLRD